MEYSEEGMWQKLGELVEYWVKVKRDIIKVSGINLRK